MLVRRRRVFVAMLVVAMATVLTLSTPVVAPAAAACVPSTGPGIPPPSSVPSGFPVYGSSWYGQSGYMTLCAGGTATATLGVYNSGSAGWGEASWKAYLGTWNPEPGQDKPSVLGGDGTNGSQNTGWPRYNRVGIQPASYVGPNSLEMPRSSMIGTSLMPALRSADESNVWSGPTQAATAAAPVHTHGRRAGSGCGRRSLGEG